MAQGPYPSDFRAEAVRLVRERGESIPDVARGLGCSTESVRDWVKQAESDEGARDGLTTDERTELNRLRRENRVLREEREILKKAAAWFAKETGSTP